MNACIIKDPSQIVSPRPGVLRGGNLKNTVIRTGDSLLIEDGVITAIAPWDELVSSCKERGCDFESLDATGKAVIPGFVDSHSHLVFGGNRAAEFELRVGGATYEEIAASGGGIASTVAATRAASVDELKASARKYLDRAFLQGTTTMEVKSGYGLDPETELKMLQVADELNREHPVDLIPTFLGAHAIPKGMEPDRYIAQLKEMMPEAARLASFCDVFCEQGYFTPAQSLDILEAARSHGMRPKMHANQFHSIGCIQAAIELEAVSVDHLEELTTEEVALLADSDVACTILPGVSLFLEIPFAPSREIIDAGCIPALASDFNPGSNMSLNLQLAQSLACIRTGMGVAEALACVTQNGAHALGLTDRGCIETGYKADLLILSCADYREMSYFYGENHVRTVIKGGQSA